MDLTPGSRPPSTPRASPTPVRPSDVSGPATAATNSGLSRVASRSPSPASQPCAAPHPECLPSRCALTGARDGSAGLTTFSRPLVPGWFVAGCGTQVAGTSASGGSAAATGHLNASGLTAKATATSLPSAARAGPRLLDGRLELVPGSPSQVGTHTPQLCLGMVAAYIHPNAEARRSPTGPGPRPRRAGRRSNPLGQPRRPWGPWTRPSPGRRKLHGYARTLPDQSINPADGAIQDEITTSIAPNARGPVLTRPIRSESTSTPTPQVQVRWTTGARSGAETAAGLMVTARSTLGPADRPCRCAPSQPADQPTPCAIAYRDQRPDHALLSWLTSARTVTW